MWMYLKNNWVLFILIMSGSRGSPCTFPWVTLCIQVGHPVHCRGSLCTFPWVTLYIPVGHPVHSGGSHCTFPWVTCIFPWVTLYIPVGHTVHSRGSPCTFRWVTLYIPVVHPVHSPSSSACLIFSIRLFKRLNKISYRNEDFLYMEIVQHWIVFC
jgi:hypothetical protein